MQTQTSTADGDRVINEIVNVVAEKEGVHPLSLTPPIYKAIDPDALYQLLSTRPTAGQRENQVTFSYQGYEVITGGDGSVSVEELEE